MATATATSTTKTTKGTKSTKANPKATVGAPKKTGLRKPQIRALTALKKAGKALTRTEVGVKGKVDLASLTEILGSSDPDTRKANDAKHFPSLISLGYVKLEPPVEETGADTYSLTAKGEAALDKAE